MKQRSDRPFEGDGTARLAWVALSLCPGVGEKTLQRICARGDPASLLELDDTTQLRGLGLSAASAAWFAESRWRRAVRNLPVRAPPDAPALRLLTPADAGWPLRMTGPAVVTPVLWMHGVAPPQSARWVAIVGSRRATPAAERLAERWARELIAQRAVVVSGGALGVDAAAHIGSLGPGAVAVLGTGLQRPHPRRHAGLFARIVAEGGLLVSREPPLQAPAPWRFPARNRVIAALCDDVIVVQAGERSGSLSTARAAVEMGRRLWVPARSVLASRGIGAQSLINARASPSLGRELREVFELWQVPGSSERSRSAPDPRNGAPSDVPLPSEAERFILERLALESKPLSVDAVLAACPAGLETRKLLATLTLLEVQGRVIRDGELLSLARSL